MTRRVSKTIYMTAEQAKQFEAHAKRARKSFSKFTVDHLCADIARTGEMPMGLADTEALRQATQKIVEVVRGEGDATRRDFLRLKVMIDVLAEMYLQHTPPVVEPAQEWFRRQAGFNGKVDRILGRAVQGAASE